MLRARSLRVQRPPERLFCILTSDHRPILTNEMHQELKDAIESIKEAAHAEGKKVAMYCNSGEDAQSYAERGFDMVSILTDQMGITGAFTQSLAVASGKVKGSGNRGVKGYDGK
jgi:4-hydroxy-2-oxoheptanedioate aldolase